MTGDDLVAMVEARRVMRRRILAALYRLNEGAPVPQGRCTQAELAQALDAVSGDVDLEVPKLALRQAGLIDYPTNVHVGLTPEGLEVAEQCPEEGRLAATVGAEHGERLPGLDGEVELLDDGGAGHIAAGPAHLDERPAHAGASARPGRPAAAGREQLSR